MFQLISIITNCRRTKFQASIGTVTLLLVLQLQIGIIITPAEKQRSEEALPSALIVNLIVANVLCLRH